MDGRPPGDGKRARAVRRGESRGGGSAGSDPCVAFQGYRSASPPPRVAQSWPKSEQNWSNSGQIWWSPGRLVDVGQALVESGQNLTDVGPSLVDTAPISVGADPKLIDSGPSWPMLVEFVRKLGTSGQSSTKVGRSRPRSNAGRTKSALKMQEHASRCGLCMLSVRGGLDSRGNSKRVNLAASNVVLNRKRVNTNRTGIQFARKS